jgi:hypothetical protein
MSKRMSYGKNYRPDVRFVRMSTYIRIYPTDAVLPANGILPSGMHPHGRGASVRTHAAMRPSRVTDAGPRPRGRGFREGRVFRILHIKGGALPLFPHFQPIPVE